MTREPGDWAFLVRLYHEIGRVDDALDAIDALVESDPCLSAEDRNLFAVVYKGAIDPLRQTVRHLKSVGEGEHVANQQERGDLVAAALATSYDHLTRVCQRALSTLSDRLFPPAPDPAAKAFYVKLQGDFHRYLAECSPPDQMAFLLERARRHYDETQEYTQYMDPCDPFRLGLVLNIAVFQYEHLDEKDRAAELLDAAFGEISDEGIANLPPGFQEEALETVRIMRRNLRLWHGELDDGE
jgi:14-3-3 protein epsilon